MNYKSIKELYLEGYSDIDIARLSGHSFLKVGEVIQKIKESISPQDRIVQATIMEREIFSAIQEEIKIKKDYPLYNDKELCLKIEMFAKFV